MAKQVSKKAKSKNKFVKLTIEKIELTEHTLNTPSHIDYGKIESFNFLFKAIVNLNPAKSIVQVVVSYKFYFEDELLFDMAVSNEFLIFNFKEFLIDEKRLDTNLLISLAGMALTQSRGIQSTLIKNTKIGSFYIPAIPRDQMVQKIKYQDELLKDSIKNGVE